MNRFAPDSGGLDAATLARARDLKWLATRPVRGAPFGRHPGRDVGPGVEFSQYRPYEPGDDARWIDWRRLARDDAALVRLAPRETRVDLCVLIDASASMAQPSDERPGWTRLDCARALAAIALGMAQRQGDRFCWQTFGGPRHVAAAGGHGPAHLAHCIASLDSIDAAGVWPTDMADAVRTLPPRGLLLVISDFLTDAARLGDLAARLSAGGREVLALQLLARSEVRFEFSNDTEFVDRETGAIVRAHGPTVRRRYLTLLAQSERALRRALSRRGIGLKRALIEDPLDQTLRAVIDARARAARRGSDSHTA